MRGRIMAISVAALLAFIAACSSPSPSATPAASPEPTSSAVAEVLPAPTCEQPPTITRIDASGSPEPVEITLTCENAVEAAAAVLPAQHLPILGIEFHFGSYCPPGAFCPFTNAQNGYVVFVTGSRGPQPSIWVRVAADKAGVVQVTTGPQPFPPILRADGARSATVPVRPSRAGGADGPR
jgi:hypothetical protein